MVLALGPRFCFLQGWFCVMGLQCPVHEPECPLLDQPIPTGPLCIIDSRVSKGGDAATECVATDPLPHVAGIVGDISDGVHNPVGVVAGTDVVNPLLFRPCVVGVGVSRPV